MSKKISTCVTVSTQYGRGHASFESVTPTTKKVHVAGHPFLWALEDIFRRAPELKVLQIIPSKKHWMQKGRYKEICREHDARVVIACHQRKQQKEMYRPSRAYQRKRRKFLYLQGEVKEKFEELLAMDCLEARVTARYFCLHNEPYISERIVAQEFHLRGDDRDVSLYVHSMRRYLFPLARVSYEAKARAGMILRRVRIHRGDIELPAPKPPRDPSLPSNLLENRITVYRRLQKAWKEGRLDKLLPDHPLWYEVLVRRYGLNGNGKPMHRSFRSSRSHASLADDNS